jgi:hypothetical protein
MEMGHFRNAYRPERHYMRGPGPKWHAKHTASLVAAASVQPMVSSNAPRAGAAAMLSSTVTAWIAPTAAAAVLGFVAVMMLA